MARRKHNPALAITHPLHDLDCLTVDLDQDEETRQWVTTVKELNGISTFGRTPEEALDRTSDMILVYLKSMDDLGLAVPLSRSEIIKIREMLSR